MTWYVYHSYHAPIYVQIRAKSIKNFQIHVLICPVLTPCAQIQILFLQKATTDKPKIPTLQIPNWLLNRATHSWEVLHPGAPLSSSIVLCISFPLLLHTSEWGETFYIVRIHCNLTFVIPSK